MSDRLKTLLKSCAAIATLGTTVHFASMSAEAGALPTHGHFASGQGQIAKAAQSLTVKQSSTTGIIDWKGFSVGKDEDVTFKNASGATLNRVTGGNPSSIAGSLHATGSLYLINNSGVIVSGSGRVVTGGAFIASSGALSNTAFDGHKRHFGTANATVVNRGSVIAGGEAKIVGSSVTNTGSLTGSHIRLRAIDGKALAGGKIDATGSTHHNAHILVIADNGETQVTGTLTARNRNGSGGTIETSGHRVAVGGHIDAGKGGSWLVDPQNLTVDESAAKTINKSLRDGTNVTLEVTKTSATGPGTLSDGNGDIVVDAALKWSSTASLTFEAYHTVKIDASISIKGAGSVALQTKGGVGRYTLSSGGVINFGPTDNGATLVINSRTYTLLYTMKDIQGINRNLRGAYALADSIDASGVKHWKPIGTNGADTILNKGNGFMGVFTGLGNHIANLRVNIEKNNYSGLFGYSNGYVIDTDVVNSSFSGAYYVGALIGYNRGTVKYDTADATVTGGDDSTGGLIGESSGEISHSSSRGTVSSSGYVGGLVGVINYGTVNFSHSSSNVSGAGTAGGLVGQASGEITKSHASGHVSGGEDTGGLIGILATESLVEDCYATGKVVAADNVGGLVGVNDYGTVDYSYATGKIIASDDGGGGLVGDNLGVVSNAYSTSFVLGEDDVGGLLGTNGGKIESSYSIGRVSSKGDHVGGLVGSNSSTVSHSYWNVQTSGQKHSAGGQGLTTAQLESGLPKGFSGAVWAIDPSVNGGFPYLIALASSY